MNIWDILEIAETTDVKKIKRAYAHLTKQVHPEEQPKEFQRLHDAYHGALSYAKMFRNEYVEVQGINDASSVTPFNDPNTTEERTESFTNVNSENDAFDDQTAYTKESMNLFMNFNSEELFQHRKQAVEKLKEIFNDYRWYDPKIWRTYISSEIFQRVKDDKEFLDYLYYVLQVMQIRIPYAKELYHGLGYDRDTYDILVSGDCKLYYLLKIYTEGPVYKGILSKIISIGCLALSLLLMYILPIVIPVIVFVHIAAYWYLIIYPKRDLDIYGLSNILQYDDYVTGVSVPFMFTLLLQIGLWIKLINNPFLLTILLCGLVGFFFYSILKFTIRYVKEK